ncbi:RimK family alpha-L-glutamate ligase [Evansella sp. AB-rgal1]|uniref:ATP-grasp domain-containing protein n=1 Tax=Evansella sp. AB-rgal1 TaxID=3242696 RepID=UPI00359D122E
MSLYGWIIYNGNLITDKFMDYVQWFQKTAEDVGVEVEHVANNELLVSLMNGKPTFTMKDGISLKEKRPDFVHFADKDLHLARHIEGMGIPLFNSSRSIEICDNKSYMYQVLSLHNIPMPNTIIAPKIYEGLPVKNSAHLELVKKQLGFPLIIKEAFGSFGQQVYWINNESELEAMLTKLGGKEFVYQAPVTTSIGTDIRLNVVGDKVVAAMKRTSETDFRANVTAGGKTMPYEPTEEEKGLAVRSAKAVGAEFAGVDLLFGENGPILCEVNSNPHLRSIYECTGLNVADYMVRYIKSVVPERGVRK